MSEDEFIIQKNINEQKLNTFLINDSSNYSLDIYHIIDKINNSIDEPSKQKNNEFILNILLMSSKLSNQNKLSCLLLLYYLYRKDEKRKKSLSYLFLKICKTAQKIEILEEEIIHKYLTIPFADDFITSMDYISLLKKIMTKDKDTEFKKSFDALEYRTKEKISLYLEENIYKFRDFNLMTDDQLKKIIEMLIQLFSDTYEINENDTPLFIIDKTWLFKMRNFIEPYIEARKENIADLLCDGAFNYSKVLDYIISKEKFESIEKSYGVIFPGPINNLNIIRIGKRWNDPMEGEEKYLVRNDCKINEDYFILKNDDWFLLKSIFKDTNEIRRKNINDNICHFKVVIIDPRLARKENIHLLQKKIIQINANNNITELKNKIIRCIDYEIDKQNRDNEYYDNLYENNDVDFFVLDKKNKELLIELFISFVNDIKVYESLYIQQINLDNNINSINDLFNYFDKDSQILIAEIIPKNCFNFIKSITSDENNSKVYNCSVCSEQLDIREKYNCSLCNISLFCSYECANISSEHINLHESLKKLYIKNFELKQLFSEKMKLYKDNPKEMLTFPKNKSNNYSAINSVIHCLSNSTDLTKYILSKKYMNDLNIIDYLLNRKTFISIYFNVINKLWNNKGMENMELYYQNLIETLLKKLEYDPNDKAILNNVTDIISFILTTLDKEINRGNNLYSTKIQNIISKTNDISIITDLFTGILQTSFSCTKCGNVSLIYDYFKYLLLPIPKKNNNLIIKYFSEFDCKYLHYTIDDNSDIKELKDKAIDSFLSEKIKNIVQMMGITDLIDITAIDSDDEKILTEVAMYNSVELVLFNKNKMVNKIFLTEKKEGSEENKEEKNENELKLNINKIFKDYADMELIFYERDVLEEPCINIYIYPFAFNEKEKMSTNKDKLYHTYPIAISAQLSLILENFEHYVNVKLRNLLLDYYKEESEKKNIDHIELVYPHYFGDSSFISSISSLYSSTTCFLCNEKTKINLSCPLFSAIDKELTIKDLMAKFDYPRQPIVLLAKSKYYDVNKKYYSNMPTFYNKKDNKKPPENKLDLYHCFQLYTRRIILDDIEWFCETCNSSQICEKQLIIYNLPVYLIIQIDRFAIRKITNKKDVDYTLLNIPINNLNLNDYVVGPEKNNINYNYNLYAIIYKDIGSRTDFTYCTCRNGNKWFLFKENKIQISNELINKYVHYLFYKREDAQQ